VAESGHDKLKYAEQRLRKTSKLSDINYRQNSNLLKIVKSRPLKQHILAS